MRQAVAISTTGDAHRLGFLETCVEHWDAALGQHDSLFVTVDGDSAACDRVARAVADWTCSVYRVGQRPGVPPYESRHGVAVSKNTGLELLMDNTSADHLFLCDDDTYPLNKYALVKHTDLAPDIPHSMVCWGNHRLEAKRGRYATWDWPRGVLLYATRRVVSRVGGMIEDFGPGGHEHVEWSRRIHQSGLTPHKFISPASYAERGLVGPATRAGVLWHCEDMKRTDETSVALGHRRKAITSVRKEARDWAAINELMRSMDGNTDFVPYGAYENGRASATLCPTSTGRGAGGEQ